MVRVKTDDIEIGFDERGAGDALIFLHGVGSNKNVWANQLASFSTRFRTIALDYPGYGESDCAPHDLERKDIARYMLGALDNLQVERAHIVGLSMGGVVALEMMRQAPHRLLSLTLADTFAHHPQGQEILERSLVALAHNTMREIAEQRVDVVLRPESTPEAKRAFIEGMASINKDSYAWAARAVWSADYRADLLDIAVPTLIIVGDEDTVTPPALSDELHAQVKRSRLSRIRFAGHISNLDNPSDFNKVLHAFLDQIHADQVHADANEN